MFGSKKYFCIVLSVFLSVQAADGGQKVVKGVASMTNGWCRRIGGGPGADVLEELAHGIAGDSLAAVLPFDATPGNIKGRFMPEESLATEKADRLRAADKAEKKKNDEEMQRILEALMQPNIKR